jgi:secreted Zn-dependent insulinase-like peptidase
VENVTNVDSVDVKINVKASKNGVVIDIGSFTAQEMEMLEETLKYLSLIKDTKDRQTAIEEIRDKAKRSMKYSL